MIEKSKLKEEIKLKSKTTKIESCSILNNFFFILNEIFIKLSNENLNFTFILEKIFKKYSEDNFGMIKEIVLKLLKIFENEKEILKLKNDILLKDIIESNENLIKKNKKGFKIELKTNCSKCEIDFKEIDKIRFFKDCKHYFHLNCIENSLICSKCFPIKKIENEIEFQNDHSRIILKYQKIEKILNEKFKQF